MTRQSTRTYASQRFYGADDPVRTIDQALADHVRARAESNLPPSRVAFDLAVGRMVEAHDGSPERREAAGHLASLMIKAFDAGQLQ